eukprot:EG_transcript_2540
MWCFRRLRFTSLEMEAEFQSRHQVTARRFCFLWLTVQLVLVAATACAGVLAFGMGVPNVPLMACQGCVVLFLLLTVLGLRFSARVSRHVYVCQCAASVVTIGWTGWLVHFVVAGLGRRAHAEALKAVWPLLTLPAHDDLENYVMTELSGKILLLCLLYNFFVLDLMRFAGSVTGLAVSCAALPLTFFVATFVSDVVRHNVTEMLVATVLVAIYAFLSGAYLSLLRRRHFELDYQLKFLLLQEADTERRAREKEAAQKFASQRADTTLNHLLKNLMADATGCIELAVGKPLAETTTYLQEAVACLGRGMQWCRRRHIILSVTQGTYTPCMSPINLKTFGQALMSGRPLQGSFVDRVVLLDPTLCELILDNAISNALRHGCPANPNVQFSMRLSQPPAKPDTAADPTAHPRKPAPLALTFRITNRADPARPALSQSFIGRVLSGEAMPSSCKSALSDNLGLQHMFHAAATYGLQLQLEQVGDNVIFTADLEVMEGEPAVKGSLAPATPRATFPAGVKILCLDDSDIARRLMVHSLEKFGGATGVRAYGKDVGELETFLQEALAGAHIVVMDQHLDYKPFSYLGTDLVGQLLGNGFRGLVCIRSANNAPEDTELFWRSGAHCVIPKDLPARGMVAELLVQYARYQHPPAEPEPVEDVASHGCCTPDLAGRQGSCRLNSADLQDADIGSPLSAGSLTGVVPSSPSSTRPLLAAIPRDSSSQSPSCSFVFLDAQFDLAA